MPQANAVRGQAQDARPAIIRIDAPIDIARRFEGIDELSRRYDITSDPEREPALVNAGFFFEGRKHRKLQWADAAGLSHLRQNAEANLVESARQMRRNAVRRRNPRFGARPFIGAPYWRPPGDRRGGSLGLGFHRAAGARRIDARHLLPGDFSKNSYL